MKTRWWWRRRRGRAKGRSCSSPVGPTRVRNGDGKWFIQAIRLDLLSQLRSRREDEKMKTRWLWRRRIAIKLNYTKREACNGTMKQQTKKKEKTWRTILSIDEMRRSCQRRMPITHLNDCFSLSLHLFVANRMKTGEEEEEAYLMIRQFFKQIAVNGEI